MSLTAAVLRKMMDKGLTLADAIEIAEAWEEGVSAPVPAYDAVAERRREYDRERKRRARSAIPPDNSTGIPPEKVSPTPPSKTTPSPPLKGGIFPTETTKPPERPSAKPAKSLSFWVAAIWEITPRPGRERSGKRDLENALRAAMRRGADPAAVKAGLEGYYASPDATKDGGQYAKGVHVVISSGRWEAFEPEPEVQKDADPWPRRLMAFEMSGYWNSEWGPKPGKPGCLAPMEQAA